MRVSVAFLMATVAMAGAAQMGEAQVSFPPMNGQRLVAPDAETGAWFGHSVAIDGDTMVVGAPRNDSGAAYVFVRAGKHWVAQQKLTASDAPEGASFGARVSIQGETIAVGAPFANEDWDPGAGATYVFARSGKYWGQQAKLVPSDSQAGDRFGAGVSLSDGRLLVGALQGAYVFDHVGSAWVQAAKLVAPHGWNAKFLGTVSLSHDTALVATVTHDTGDGETTAAACVYVRTAAGWAFEQALPEPEWELYDEFGFAVAVSDDMAIVGAYCKDTDDGTDAGVAYTYVRSGSKWVLTQTLAAPDGGEHGLFGYSMAVESNRAVIGAAQAEAASGERAGAVYVLSRSGAKWKVVDRLESVGGWKWQELGSAVALSNGTIAMGADHERLPGMPEAGAVYVTGFGIALQ